MKNKFLVVAALILLSATSCRAQSVVTDSVRKDTVQKTEVVIIHDDVYWQPTPYWYYQSPMNSFYLRPHYRGYIRNHERFDRKDDRPVARKQEGKRGQAIQPTTRGMSQYRTPQMRGNMQMRGNINPSMHYNMQRPAQNQMRSTPPTNSGATRSSTIRREPTIEEPSMYELPMDEFINYINYKQ